MQDPYMSNTQKSNENGRRSHYRCQRCVLEFDEHIPCSSNFLRTFIGFQHHSSI